MKVGDKVKRNFSPIFAVNGYTDTKVKSICSGAVYEVIKKKTESAGYSYVIQNKPGDTYNIASIDLYDHFYVIDGVEETSETQKEDKKCTCCSISLREFGCKCNAVPNLLEKRYSDMQKDMFGPRKD